MEIMKSKPWVNFDEVHETICLVHNFLDSNPLRNISGLIIYSQSGRHRCRRRREISGMTN